LKEKLEELDINWRFEIRNYLENLIRKNIKETYNLFINLINIQDFFTSLFIVRQITSLS